MGNHLDIASLGDHFDGAIQPRDGMLVPMPYAILKTVHDHQIELIQWATHGFCTVAGLM
jgi:hypothetical protein